jgi:heme peroxidase
VDVPNNATRTDHAFLDDIAHNAVPKPGLTPDTDTAITGATGAQPSGTYDDEMLDRHFIAGDGRVNENIGLTAVHQIFHSEHNRLVDYIEGLITAQDIDVTEWQLAPGVWNGERIFQAAHFMAEMEYQHLVFEEFARKIQPLIDPFQPFAQPQTDVNPAIPAEFAHAVYRFGHSMLTDTRARDAGVPSLNNFRRQIFTKTNDGSMRPYTDWVDFALSLKHPYSAVNFMAAYGKHPSITSQATAAGKHGAAKLIYDNDQTVAATPADAADFVNGTGAWADTPTGLDDVDLWVGGLAEKQNLFGGLLGSTFNYVFESRRSRTCRTATACTTWRGRPA